MSFGNLFADPIAFGLGILSNLSAHPMLGWVLPFAVGVAAGAIVVAICFIKPRKHFWIVVLRLTPDLRRKLKGSAKAHRTSLRAEIIARLEHAFTERPKVVNLPERSLLLEKQDHNRGQR